MYCPNCATENKEDTKFCRACGTNLSLVPKAITGQLKLSRQEKRAEERSSRGRLGQGITQLFMGLGFALVAMALGLSQQGQGWWYWMLIPAFSLLGKGVADVVLGLQEQKKQQAAFPKPAPPVIESARRTGEVIAASQREIPIPPPSVTETTTRHLDAPQRREPESR
jgi:hypothetical protein